MENILLSCAGRRVELLQILRRALRSVEVEGEVVAADAQPFAPAFVVAERRAIVPPIASESFASKMLQVCVDQNVRWVIPTIDTELPILAAAREAFAAQGVTVMVSSPETIAIAASKRATHAWFVEHGFPTFCQTSPQQALADPQWVYPCFAKPSGGSRSIGAMRIDTPEQLRSLDPALDYVVESLGQGVEVTVDAYVSPQTGRCVCAVPRQRLEVRAGEVSKGKTIEAPAIVDMVKRVCEALPGAYGVLCIQLFYKPDTAHIQLMEINPRFGGGYPLTDAAGAKFARWFLEDTLQLPSTANEDWARDLVMMRYDQAVYVRG